VLVLDKNYQPIRIVDVRGAVYLVFREAANILDQDYNVYNLQEWLRTSDIRCIMDRDFKYLSSVNNKFGIPNIIVLKNFIQKKIRTSACTKKNIFLRDMYTCQYCKKHLGHGNCTIDHIVPSSKGGELSWTNAVTSCRYCNNTKGHKSLDEWGQKLTKEPKPLKWDHRFFRNYIGRYPNRNWERFLGVKDGKI
jgi:5-methylcytosine-specific restriction endonuclease McrA